MSCIILLGSCFAFGFLYGGVLVEKSLTWEHDSARPSSYVLLRHLNVNYQGKNYDADALPLPNLGQSIQVYS